VLFRSGKVHAFDEKYEQMEQDYDREVTAIDEEIEKITSQFDFKITDERLAQRKAALEAKRDTINEKYEKRSDRYLERKERWEAKLMDRLGQ
jgi:Skp family chaperone for outer membrane proteins